MKQLQEVLEKWAVIIREINTDMVLADAIDKIQDSLRGVLDAMRRIVRPLWGGTTPSEMKIGQTDQHLSDALPEILEGLAQAVDEFISGLSALPFLSHVRRRVMEEARRPLLDFNRDLLYWSINLRQFSGGSSTCCLLLANLMCVALRPFVQKCSPSPRIYSS
ncbi:uncharacterized protein EI90DRAFT_695688 [Cantharellus anzutake]|uniref:uncharacterized protein n=1 Tax=Cantharellus anzutake TaxID=1750568 RepID=UPI00190516EA|nr:uncharacterized protein EI90DRAFT_695688 [Cantharellus anzutake]KAF8332724.1 hypothetical protein EI90DRAFT_695688 [Cantharellus anzutake]